jgi:hypothetical protein
MAIRNNQPIILLLSSLLTHAVSSGDSVYLVSPKVQ